MLYTIVFPNLVNSKTGKNIIMKIKDTVMLEKFTTLGSKAAKRFKNTFSNIRTDYDKDFMDALEDGDHLRLDNPSEEIVQKALEISKEHPFSWEEK